MYDDLLGPRKEEDPDEEYLKQVRNILTKEDQDSQYDDFSEADQCSGDEDYDLKDD